MWLAEFHLIFGLVSTEDQKKLSSPCFTDIFLLVTCEASLFPRLVSTILIFVLPSLAKWSQAHMTPVSVFRLLVLLCVLCFLYYDTTTPTDIKMTLSDLYGVAP